MLIPQLVKPGSTVYIPVNTFDSNDPSASVTVTNWANTDCHVHKDGGTTQRSSSSGETLSLNFDGITGQHLLAIDLSDNSDAGFYTAGSTYHVRIEGVTVDGGNINAWIGAFRIGYEGALLDTTIATLASQTSFTLSAGSADDDAYNGCVALVHDVASGVQIAVGVVSDYVGPTKTVTLAADPGIFTMAAADNISLMPPALLPATPGRRLSVDANGRTDVASIEGSDATDQIAASVWDAQTTSHSTANTFGSLEQEHESALDEIETDTQNIQSRLPAALVGGRIDASVGAINNIVAAAAQLALSAAGILSGTTTASTLSTTQVSSDLTGYGTDVLRGHRIEFLTGDAAGATSQISANDSAGLLTFAEIQVTPAEGDTFVLV